ASSAAVTCSSSASRPLALPTLTTSSCSRFCADSRRPVRRACVSRSRSTRRTAVVATLDSSVRKLTLHLGKRCFERIERAHEFRNLALVLFLALRVKFSKLVEIARAELTFGLTLGLLELSRGGFELD